MATVTLGTNANSSLTALQVQHGGLAPADIATIQANIKNDGVDGNMVIPGSFTLGSGGLLYIPRRGVLKVFAGDYVAVDTTTGWPILVSKNAIASGPWTHS